MKHVVNGVYKMVLSTLGRTTRKDAATLTFLADAARDARNFALAAEIYDEVLTHKQDNAAAFVQCGHMYKEIGRYAEAESRYLAALSLSPDDPDLQLQLGHFMKILGRLDEALDYYRKAVELAPKWTVAVQELERAERIERAPHNLRLVQSTAARRSVQNSESTEFLKNVPAEDFRMALEAIAESGRYYLLNGLETRVGDPALDRASIQHAISVCITAERFDLVRRIGERLMDDDRFEPEFACIILNLLALVPRGRQESDAEEGATVPNEALVGVHNTALGVILRQSALINALFERLGGRGRNGGSL